MRLTLLIAICTHFNIHLEKWDIDYWIYGHNHWNNDVDVFGIKFRSNMMGYVVQNEHKSFIRDKTITIETV